MDQMDIPGLEIKYANRGDAEAIVQFCLRGAKETLGKELDEGSLRDGISHVLRETADFYIVARLEAAYVGQLKVHRQYYDWYDTEFWWIEHVYVDPDYRRRGILKEMLQYIADLAVARENVKYFLLFVSRTNERAIKAYEKFGFDKPSMDIMRLSLQDVQRG